MVSSSNASSSGTVNAIASRLRSRMAMDCLTSFLLVAVGEAEMPNILGRGMGWWSKLPFA